MWEGQALPHDTKFSNRRCEIVGRRVIFIWSWIPGSSWSGLIKAEPGLDMDDEQYMPPNQMAAELLWVQETALVRQYQQPSSDLQDPGIA